MNHAGRILVTGATGNVGRHLVAQLLRRNAEVRALVRNPATAGLPAGTEIIQGDLTTPETLEKALDGVESVFLLWPLFSADAAPDVVDLIAKHARHVVYLSAAGDDGQPAEGFWSQIERLIESSRLEWTFIRAGGFATNTLGWSDEIRTGVVRWPYGQAGRSLVHEADLAAVAAHALTVPGHSGAAYHVTGPEQVTQADQVRIIGDVIGQPVRWEEMPLDEARDVLMNMWGDPTFVEEALNGWAAMVDTPEPVTTAVEDITGTPARTFRQWALDHADDFRAPTAAAVSGHPARPTDHA